MLSTSRGLLSTTKGPTFVPYTRRVIDRRLAPNVEMFKAQVTQRHGKNRELMMKDRELRQTEPPHWSAAKRPTHFLSLRMPANSNIAYIAQIIQKHVFDEHREYMPLLIPIPRLHLTMSVMTCADDAQIAKAGEIVTSVLEDLKPPPFTLAFQGLGTFARGRVVVARVAAEKDSVRLEETVKRIRAALLNEGGIDIKGNPFDSYVAHVTVAKVRPKHEEALGIKVVPPVMYRPFVEETFGNHTFSTVDLCAMQGSQDDGYYPIVKTLQLAKS